MGHREDRALEGGQTLLERLRGLDVEVVGRLVEQEERRPGQLEQQDLEARLLPAGQRLEGLLPRVRELVAVEDPAGRLAAQARPVIVAAVEDRQQGAADELGVLMGLDEPPRAHPRSEPRPAGVRHGRDDRLADRQVVHLGVAATGGEQPQEVRLARAVGAEHRDPFAVPDLEVEGLHEPGELEPLADDGALAGAAAVQPHRHPLLAWLLGGWPVGLEALQPGPRRLVAGGHVGVVLGFLLVHEHERLELGVLLVPPLAQLLEAGEALLPRLVVGPEPTGVGPHAVARAAQLDGDDAGGGVGEQLAVVTDVEDRLVAGPDLLLHPDLAGDVEVVVRLVEE